MPRGPSAVVHDDYLMNTEKYGSSFGKQKVKVVLQNHIQTAENYAGDNFESTCLGHDTFSAHRCSTYYCMWFFRFMLRMCRIWTYEHRYGFTCKYLSQSRSWHWIALGSTDLTDLSHETCQFESNVILKCLTFWLAWIRLPGTSNIRPLKSRALQKNYPWTLDPPPGPSERAWRVMKPQMRFPMNLPFLKGEIR